MTLQRYVAVAFFILWLGTSPCLAETDKVEIESSFESRQRSEGGQEVRDSMRATHADGSATNVTRESITNPDGTTTEIQHTFGKDPSGNTVSETLIEQYDAQGKLIDRNWSTTRGEEPPPAEEIPYISPPEKTPLQERHPIPSGKEAPLWRGTLSYRQQCNQAEFSTTGYLTVTADLALRLKKSVLPWQPPETTTLWFSSKEGNVKYNLDGRAEEREGNWFHLTVQQGSGEFPIRATDGPELGVSQVILIFLYGIKSDTYNLYVSLPSEEAYTQTIRYPESYGIKTTTSKGKLLIEFSLERKWDPATKKIADSADWGIHDSVPSLSSVASNIDPRCVNGTAHAEWELFLIE